MPRDPETVEIKLDRVGFPGTSLRVSAIALGTWAIGGWMWGGTDEAEAIRTIQEAVDHGITLIDTAPAYGFGRSEEIVGKALAEAAALARADRNKGWPRLERRTTVPQWFPNAHPQRDRAVPAAIADRCHRHLSGALARPQSADRGDRGSDGGSAAHGQDSGDWRQQFQPCANRCLPQGRACAHDTVRRTIGSSAVSKQPFFPIVGRGTLPHLPTARCAGGCCSGRMSAQTQFAGDDLRKSDPKFRAPRFAQYLRAVERLDRFAQENYGRRVIHLALRWVLDRQASMIALWGARRPDQLEPLAGLSGWHIDSAAMVEIDRILSETIVDAIGPEFMAPPDQLAA